MNAYIAGPMFNEGERWFQAEIDARVTRAGLDSFLPQRDGSGLDTPADVKKIYIEDRDEAATVDVVVACLNGMDVDSGTAWEMGWAHGKGRYVVGIYTDYRLHYKFQTVNLMIQESLDYLATSLDDLEQHLRDHLRASQATGKPQA